MKVAPDPKLFWFLKEGIELDLDNPSTLDMYVQQILTRGRAKDVKFLLKTTGIKKFEESF